MGYEAEIRRAIAEKKTELEKDEQFFSSEYYFRFLRQYVTTALGKKAPKGRVELECFAERGTDRTAWTEGHTVHVNTRGPLIRDLSTRMLQHYSIIGHIVHECLHILLSDFSAMKGCVNGILQASWYETPKNPDAEQVLEDLRQKPLKRKLCASICKELINIHEDGFIENYGYVLFPGVFAAGIHVMDDQLFEKSAAVEDMLAGVKRGDVPFISTVMNCMLLDAMHYPEKSTGEALEDNETEELYDHLHDLLEACRPYTEALRWEQNGGERMRLILELLCVLYPVIPEVEEPMGHSAGSAGTESQGERTGENAEEGEHGNRSKGSSGNSSGMKSGESSGPASKGQSGTPSEGSSREQEGASSGDPGRMRAGSPTDGQASLASSGTGEAGLCPGNCGRESAGTAAGSGQPSPEAALAELLSNISSAMNQAMSAEPKGDGSPDSSTLQQAGILNSESSEASGPSGTPGRSAAAQAAEAAEAAREDAARNASEQEAAVRELNAAMNQMIKADAESAAENMHAEHLRREAEAIRMKALHEHGLENAGWCYEVSRKPEPSEQDIQNYLDDHEEVRQWSEPSIRMLRRILKEREESGPAKGYMTGRFSAPSYARNACLGGGNCFTRNRLPIGKPKCAFALCIDESGSMDFGGKLTAARKTAVLLNEILSDMQVAHMIYGHRDSRGTCQLDVYHDFEEPDRKDRYRLGGVSSDARNRDGAAIAYGCEKLLKRPETQKILIVISDGLPTETSFHPELEYEADAAAVAKEYSRRKVTIFGAVIDGNVERIRNIYGKHTMDLTDLSRLPQELGNLVSRVVRDSR